METMDSQPNETLASTLIFSPYLMVLQRMVPSESIFLDLENHARNLLRVNVSNHSAVYFVQTQPKLIFVSRNCSQRLSSARRAKGEAKIEASRKSPPLFCSSSELRRLQHIFCGSIANELDISGIASAKLPSPFFSTSTTARPRARFPFCRIPNL